jgi:hypothetical protein
MIAAFSFRTDQEFHMKSQLLWSPILVAFALFAGPAAAQPSQRPHFFAETIAEFQSAYQKHYHRVLDPAHTDVRKYHAYRVITSGSSTAVTARSVTVDAAGHLHIIGEPGTIAKGQTSTGPGEMHILLPITVSPPF